MQSINRLADNTSPMDTGTRNDTVATLIASRHNRMEPIFWIPGQTTALLDVGCNVGALLSQCRHYYPNLHLAGIDINESSIQSARASLPGADLHQGYGSQLPFASGSFQCVTCIEVIEHVPEEHRASLLAEMWRVLAPGGRLILRCPHAGIFSWLDAQNFRFRFPRLHRLALGAGNRDAQYQEAQEEICWHHHFTREELEALAGSGWELEVCRFGGLFLFPLTDIVGWPLNRLGRSDHWFRRFLEKVANMDLGISYGRSSYGILLVWKKRGAAQPGTADEIALGTTGSGESDGDRLLHQ
jgi:SAM-dependent methyltransferase